MKFFLRELKPGSGDRGCARNGHVEYVFVACISGGDVRGMVLRE
jgi:hypothetical protein